MSASGSFPMTPWQPEKSTTMAFLTEASARANFMSHLSSHAHAAEGWWVSFAWGTVENPRLLCPWILLKNSVLSNSSFHRLVRYCARLDNALRDASSKVGAVSAPKQTRCTAVTFQWSTPPFHVLQPWFRLGSSSALKNRPEGCCAEYFWRMAKLSSWTAAF